MLITAPIFLLLVIFWMIVASAWPIKNGPGTHGTPFRKFVYYNVIAYFVILLTFVIMIKLV